MRKGPRQLLKRCETLMLDMDGTLLDLKFDNYMWLTLVPQAYATRHGLSETDARTKLAFWYERLAGTLDWYCLDHWSDRLDLDVLALHREHRAKIGFLPGAREFLEMVADRDIRVILTTNSHEETLALKAEATGLSVYFDEIYTSHALGYAKEDHGYWQSVEAAEQLDRDTTLFVDDNPAVLESAASYGFENLLHVTRPDTSQPVRAQGEFTGIEAVADLLVSDR